MSPRFPNELFELFVDEVANNTNRAHRASALKSCALASTCTSKRARSHLFSDISLRWTSKRGKTVLMKTRSRILKQLMESDPIIITFIRVFEVHINDCNDEGIQEEYGLPAIITMLYSSPRSRLHSFSLSSFKFRFTPWDSLPIPFRAALSNLCQSGSLKSLSLIHLQGIPSRLITKCHTNLQRLYLFHTGFNHFGKFPPLETGRTSLSRVEELHTDNSIVYLEQGLEREQNVSILLGLRELHCVVRDENDADGYWKIIQASSNSLTDLRLSLKGRHPNALEHIQIGLLARLRSLSFQATCSQYDNWIPATTIFSFLRSSHSSSLTHLSIDILVYLTPTNPRYHFIRLGRGWDILDSAISSPSSFPSLESVTIRLISPGLMRGLETEAVDEARWDVSVRDLSGLAVAWFPRTAQRMCGAPGMELKFLMLDYVGEGT